MQPLFSPLLGHSRRASPIPVRNLKMYRFTEITSLSSVRVHCDRACVSGDNATGHARDRGWSILPGIRAPIDNLHGWRMAIPFLVNYVGHPMQGAVSGFIFVQNDPECEKAEFGKNRAYGEADYAQPRSPALTANSLRLARSVRRRLGIRRRIIRSKALRTTSSLQQSV